MFSKVLIVLIKYRCFRCKKWVINTRRDDLHSRSTDRLHRNNLLCAKHFELSQFMNSTSRNTLIHCAVPTLFDFSPKPLKITPSRPPSKQRYEVPSTSAWEKIALTDYDEPLMPSGNLYDWVCHHFPIFLVDT